MTARGPLPRRHYRHGLLSTAPRTPAPTTPFVAKTCASLGSSPICLPERRVGAFRPPVLSHQPPQRLPRLAESKVKEANRIASTAKSPITLCHLGAQQRRWCIPIARISAWTPAARNAAAINAVHSRTLPSARTHATTRGAGLYSDSSAVHVDFRGTD